MALRLESTLQSSVSAACSRSTTTCTAQRPATETRTAGHSAEAPQVPIKFTDSIQVWQETLLWQIHAKLAAPATLRHGQLSRTAFCMAWQHRVSWQYMHIRHETLNMPPATAATHQVWKKWSIGLVGCQAIRRRVPNRGSWLKHNLEHAHAPEAPIRKHGGACISAAMFMPLQSASGRQVTDVSRRVNTRLCRQLFGVQDQQQEVVRYLLVKMVACGNQPMQ
eukprot:118578-Chlamydomonas_euryale.AAC.8